MGNRANRRRMTRAEKIRGQRSEDRGQKSEDRDQRSEKTERERRREISPETRALAQAYAKVMGWPLERVLPHAECR